MISLITDELDAFSVLLKKMKRVMVTLWLIVLSIAIMVLFWHNQWVYSLPTPVPTAYKVVNPGESIHLKINRRSVANPLFLHFFNPDCPCSKFNMPHFQSLVKQYGNRVDFAIVVMTSNVYTKSDIQRKYDLKIPVFFDSSLAVSCGVYSTPQAVIISSDDKLYYRGNYNKNRYCTDPKTNYAQQALVGLLNRTVPINFDQFALKAYGCQLPNCTQQ